jgi:hypothetical protein
MAFFLLNAPQDLPCEIGGRFGRIREHSEVFSVGHRIELRYSGAFWFTPPPDWATRQP